MACSLHRPAQVNLVIWLPGMFLLGLALMGVCELFRRACSRI